LEYQKCNAYITNENKNREFYSIMDKR
jgi:hypothetical protein